jgi:uncharacterized lipoprotein YajG
MKRMTSLMLVLLLAATVMLAACHRAKSHKPVAKPTTSQPAGVTTTQPSDE